MNKRLFGIVITAAAAAGIASAQSFSRQAIVRGGGNPNEGRCTVEVVVDGAAEVEIRGNNAVLRNLSGQPPQWRRFECTSPMPSNPTQFRFSGVDGRGRQDLVRDPRNGGAAVVRIEDPDGGAEGYTFDLAWNNNGYPITQGGRVAPDNLYSYRPQDRNSYREPDQDPYHRDRDTWFRNDNWRPWLFQRVREDLEHVARFTSPFGGDNARLERTNFELDELQSKLDRGYYDQRELDEVIAALRVVVQNNRLPYRERQILSDDLNRLRDYRVRHDRWGGL